MRERQKTSSFNILFLSITIFLGLLIILAIGSLFFISSPSLVIKNIFSPNLWYSIKLSVFTSIISTTIVMFFALPTGYTFSRYSFFGKNLFKAIIDLPIAFPETVLGLSLLLIFGHPVLSKILPIVFTKKGIILAQFFTAISFAVRILKTSFDSIDTHLELVSRSLGQNQFKTFFKVTLPLAKNGIIAATVITIARCMGSFGAVLIFAGGTPSKTDTLPVFLYLNLSYGNLDMAITAGIVLVLFSFVSIYIIEKYN